MPKTAARNIQTGRTGLRFIVCLWMSWVPVAGAFAGVELEPFERAALECGTGLEFALTGGSLLENKRLKQEGRAELQLAGTLRKAYLLWSGEVKGDAGAAGRIRFIAPGGKAHAVRADKLWRKKSAGTVYAAMAEVTQWIERSGRYGVKELAADNVNPQGKDPYTVAGWALAAIAENRAAKKASCVLLHSGLELLRPGEIYDLALPPGDLPEGKWHLTRLGVVGGHGRAGNGSGNLLDGRAVSGGDDWDGSAGKFWDIDVFDLESPLAIGKEAPPTLTVDPLLQWLYPIAVVLRLNPFENGG